MIKAACVFPVSARTFCHVERVPNDLRWRVEDAMGCPKIAGKCARVDTPEQVSGFLGRDASQPTAKLPRGRLGFDAQWDKTEVLCVGGSNIGSSGAKWRKR